MSNNLGKTIFQSENSRYRYGGQVEESAHFAEWWERAIIPADSSDKFYTIERQYEGRADLLGTIFLGDASLAWVILQLNNVLDPTTEMVAGTTIRIPTIARITSLFSSEFSSVNSTRGA
jgi:uncharacterized protein YbaP (TraB family)